MAEGLMGSVSDVVSIFTTNVVPLITSSPISYFFGASLLGLGIGVFRKLRRTI